MCDFNFSLIHLYLSYNQFKIINIDSRFNYLIIMGTLMMKIINKIKIIKIIYILYKSNIVDTSVNKEKIMVQGTPIHLNKRRVRENW